MLKHIIFDFDGVIADTFDINWSLSQEYDPTVTPEIFLEHHDGNVYAEPRIKFKPEHVPLFFKEYRNRLTSSHLAQSIGPIARLGEKYALHVISSTSEVVISEVLEKSGVIPLFVRIMGLETHSSKMEKFKILMKECNVTPDNSIFITDTLGDIKEANQVNIKTIAETFGFHPRERLVQGNPFKIVDSWEEIENVIATL